MHSVHEENVVEAFIRVAPFARQRAAVICGMRAETFHARRARSGFFLQYIVDEGEITLGLVLTARPSSSLLPSKQAASNTATSFVL